jgi:acyl-coenzyme A thioesterase PaaI-like protein
VDRTAVAAALLDDLPANRTLGLTITGAAHGEGQAVLPVREPVHNIIGALHASGVSGLADAAALAAILSAAPDEATARRIQPLGIRLEIDFRRPLRGIARARCRLDDHAANALADLFALTAPTVGLSTVTTIDGENEPAAAVAVFEWTIRLRP